MNKDGLLQQAVEIILDEGREVRVRLAGGGRARLAGVVAPVEEALLKLHQYIHPGCYSSAAAPGEHETGEVDQN